MSGLFDELRLWTRIAHTKEAPLYSYLIYSMEGGIYYVLRKDYNSFATIYLENYRTVRNSLTMDLNFAQWHNIVLDIDIEYSTNISYSSIVYKYVTDVAIPTLRQILDVVKCYTIICTHRSNGGLHFYLPELTIPNDDYLRMCEQMQPDFCYECDGLKFKLDIPVNFNLAYSSKPNTVEKYNPYLIFLVDNTTHNVFELSFGREDLFNSSRNVVMNRFKRKKVHDSTVFPLFITRPYEQAIKHAFKYMMPVSLRNVIKQSSVCYRTKVVNCQPLDASNEVEVARIVNTKLTNKYLVKSTQLEVMRAGDVRFNFSFNYLLQNLSNISEFETNCPSLNGWWNRLMTRKKSGSSTGVFQAANELLKQVNPDLLDDRQPIKTVMEYSQGVYFIPMFYALFQTMEERDYDKLINDLRSVLTDKTCLKLLDVLSCISSAVIRSSSYHFSNNTIVYIGCVIGLRKMSDKEFYSFVSEKYDVAIKSCDTPDQMCKLILDICEIYLPVRCVADAKYYWHHLKGQWIKCTNKSNDDSRHLLNALFFGVRQHWLASMGNAKFPLNRSHLNDLYSVLMSRCIGANENIPLDKHKWSLSVSNCLSLCLLTGRLFYSVPELYQTSKSVYVMPTDRFAAQDLVDNERLRNLFRMMWNREFLGEFIDFMKTNQQGDYVELLRDFLWEKDGSIHFESYSDEMLRFYVHLCKFLRFDFDEMYFMLHVMASCLVATNYGKYLFFLHGNKNNGKSKFFQMLKEVFGTYSAAINSYSLCMAVSESRDTQPDIARNIFCCRVIIAEELGGKVNQNFLKVLSGNSDISTRALYENSRHGVPSAKIWISTNVPPNCTTTDAFTERVVPFHFAANFVGANDVPETIEEQIKKGIFKGEQDDDVVIGCKHGIFLHLIYMHLENFNRSTGLLEYPTIPDSIQSFKSDYLQCTDLYIQFKIFADVQSSPTEMVTKSDLQTAVRKFLITNKLKNVKESDIISRFEEEFTQKEIEIDDDEEEEENDEVGEIDYFGIASTDPPAEKKQKFDEPKRKRLIFENVRINSFKTSRGR